MKARAASARRLTPLGLVVVAALGGARPARAESGRIWSERPTGSAPLTGVPDFRLLARQVIPAVVSIQVEQKVHGAATRGGPPRDYLHRYFGGDIPHEFHNRGLGSGFIIDREGLMLTNYHVVEDAASIEVSITQPDGTEQRLGASVVGAAPRYDVALLRTESRVQATLAYLGDSNGVDIGDWVMAVGNPFGLSHSVSVGIISAKERRDIAPSGRQGLYNFLQTDASINPGNSGGPLINMRGEVIGINSAINAAGAGIGFAIPINMVKDMLPELLAKGRFARGWLGIRIQSLTPELAQSFGMPAPRGALISQVLPDSPAAHAGIREGDIVLSFDGKPVRASNDLPLYVGLAGVGKPLALTLWRDRGERTVQVQVLEFPPDAQPADALPTVDEPADEPEAGALGMKVADVTPALQRELDLPSATGVVVRDVDPSGAAARAGLQPGDLLLEINQSRATTARAVAEAVKSTAPQGLLRFKVSRLGATVFVAMHKPGQ